MNQECNLSLAHGKWVQDIYTFNKRKHEFGTYNTQKIEFDVQKIEPGSAR